MEVTGSAKFVRTAPDKLRFLVPMIKGKNVDWALTQLQFSGKLAARPLILVLKQAKDQLKDKTTDFSNFKIKEILINEGPKLKRRRILHQGRSTTILKRMSHIKIVLADGQKEKKPTDKTKIGKDRSK